MKSEKIIIIVLLLVLMDLVESFVNYSELNNEKSAVDLYQLRTNTVFDAEHVEKQVSTNNLDSFGRVPYDPYYIGVKVKITAKIKKRNDIGARESSALLNPHSRGVSAARLVSYRLDTTPPIPKNTLANTNDIN